MKISIIVPIYNSELYLKKCLDSIINQTYKNLEIILVNDGSTDNSKKICLEYQKLDERIKLINQKNQGPGIARNNGIKTSSGDYIAFIDSDDYVDIDYIEYIYTLIKKYNTDIAITNVDDIKSIKNINKKDTLKLLSNFKINSAPWGKLYKKNIVKNIYFSTTKNYEDIMFVGQTFMNSNKIVISNVDKYHYQKRPNSLSTSSFNITEYDRVNNSYELYKLIKEKENSLKNEFKLYYCANAVGCINKMIISNKLDNKLIKKMRKQLKENIFILLKSDYSFRRKIQYIIFAFSFTLYKKMYKILNRGV